jgi:hypothetical protein
LSFCSDPLFGCLIVTVLGISQMTPFGVGRLELEQAVELALKFARM